MLSNIIETIENTEEGTKCNIVISIKIEYNVVFIDTDSNQVITSFVKMENIKDARAKAKHLLNK